MKKLGKSFYHQAAQDLAPQILGKFLVYNSPLGKISGKIVDIEAYPAFIDNINHGNKRTKRTEIMYRQGGYVYIYLIYGVHYQFGIVVNKEGIPDALLIRAVIPEEGIEIMKQNFGREVKDVRDLTKSPGNLSKAFGFTMELYGEDLTGGKVYIEDRGVKVDPLQITVTKRVGISSKLEGHDLNLRFLLSFLIKPLDND